MYFLFVFFLQGVFINIQRPNSKLHKAQIVTRGLFFFLLDFLLKKQTLLIFRSPHMSVLLTSPTFRLIPVSSYFFSVTLLLVSPYLRKQMRLIRHDGKP